MKQLIKVSAFLFAITISAFIPATHNPIGHWKITYTNGANEYVDFYKDGTYKSTSDDGTLTHQGNYKVSNDVISINDKEGCGDNYWGTYKLTFYTEDSVLNTVMEDSCTGRRETVTGSILIRQKDK